MKKEIAIIDYIILLLTTGYVLLTLYFWSYFPVGIYVVIGFVFLVWWPVYSALKSKNLRWLYATYLLYLSFLIIYFIFWGFASWGTAFVGLFVRIITPFFLIANAFGLASQYARRKG